MSRLVRRALVWSLCAMTVPGVVLGGARPSVATTDVQDAVRVIDVPLRSTRDVALSGVTDVVVVDDAVCRAELTAGGLRITGLRRGDSVVLAWVGDTRVTLLVRVEPPPLPPALPVLTSERQAQLGLGHLASTAQVAIGPDRRSTYYYQHAFGWSQQTEEQHVSVRGQARHTSAREVPLNVETLSLRYARPGVAVSLLDFGLSLNGGADARVTTSAPLGVYTLRGADLTFTRGQGEVELFGGTSIPASFRTLRGTSHVAGVNLGYRVSRQVHLYSTTAGISTPSAPGDPGGARRAISVFSTAGVTVRDDDRWAAQATAGAGTGGFHGDGAVAVTGDRLSASASASSSSPSFALNRLQLLSGGGTAIRANGSWRATSRLGASMFYQHSRTRASSLFPSFAGQADYLNPAINLALPGAQSLSLNGVYSRSRGGLSGGGETRLRSLDAGWTSRLFDRVTNTLQVSGRSSEDPQFGASGFGLGLRNHTHVRLGSGSLTLGLQRNQEDPSLASRLRLQLSLLSPDLQERFLADPIGFVQSDALPSEVRDLLGALTSTQSQVSVSGEYRFGRRLNLTASFGRLSSAQRSTTDVFGYALAYDLAPGLQLRSSLSDTYLVDPRQGDLVRTTTFQVGVQVHFSGGPALLSGASRDYRIEGRVFIDRDVSGTVSDTESGLGGIMVRLDNGRTAVTDPTGRYEFRGLKAGEYRIAMPLDQFKTPVRVTSTTSRIVELFERRQATADFGVVNFSRVWGTVFNDYALEGMRRGDSPGLDRVAVIVTDDNGLARRVLTDGSGDYRLDDLAPGAYRLEVDPATIPPNFLYLGDATTFEVQPIQTKVVDVPVRALRSLAGRVSVSQAAGGEGQAGVAPVAGVTVVAGRIEATTDANGYFILRDLPAGDLTVTVRPDRSLPPGMSAPSGTVRMPKDPIAVEGAAIIIRNPALLDYLAPGRGSRLPGR